MRGDILLALLVATGAPLEVVVALFETAALEGAVLEVAAATFTTGSGGSHVWKEERGYAIGQELKALRLANLLTAALMIAL